MFLQDPVTIFLSITLCLCLIYLLYGWNQTVYKNFPPGPKLLPFIGNMFFMKKKRPHEVFKELSDKYGPVFSIQMGSQRMVIICGYEAVKDALVNHADEFAGRAKMPIINDISKGYGVIFSDGENWKVMRRFTLTTLRDFGMGKKTLEDRINEECDFLVQKLESFNGQPFENTIIMNSAVANIIVSILLGHRFDYEDPKFLRLMSLINENIRLVASPIIRLYNSCPSLMRWLPGTHQKVHENVSELRRFIKDTFTQYRENLDVTDQRNLIDVYLVKQREENKSAERYFHDNNLTALVNNLFVAGMETTSTTLRWGLLLMMKYPEIQKKVQNEIENVIGSARPQMEHKKRMPYTDAVIHEIQRFGSIIPTNVPHATTQDVTFRGYFIPKGTMVIPVLTSVLRDTAYFEKPYEFYPEHFLNSEGNFVRNDAFMPFSAGRRICAGENLAKMELFLFFTSLLQKFTFRPPPGAPDIDLTPGRGATNAPKIHQMCALPRT
ncbi:cytochrome P450 2C29-like isoform 1-T4 [Discoglossus pictus]